MTGAVAIIGAGLAGSACANTFSHAGFTVSVYEQGPAPAAGASGVPLAMFAPSVSADDAPHSRLLRRGVHILLDELRRLTAEGLLIDGTDWALTGVLERCLRVHKKLPSVWLEPEDPLALQSRVLANPSAERVWGLPALDIQEIFHGAAGWVNPAKLIEAWLTHPSISIQPGVQIASLDDPRLQDFDAVVVACGYQTTDLLRHLKTVLQPIRGQIEWGLAREGGHPINGMGHWIEGAGKWLAGATFQRNDSDLEARCKDADLNFEKLALLRPELDELDLERLGKASQSWVGVRTALKSRTPLVMQLDPEKHAKVWVCTALGSRGLSLAALCAQDLIALVQK